MAKPLVFAFAGETIACQLEKIDRSKLYGYVDTEVQDESGKACELITLAGDGRTLVAKGGTGQAYLSPSGLWRSKTELKPVDLEGQPIVPVKSSFEAPIELTQTASIDEFLSHVITSVYLLAPDETSAKLDEQLAAGTIYTFPFSYRGGLEGSTGFLLRNPDGLRFMLVGQPAELDFVGLHEVAAIVDDDTADTPDDDALNFDMV